MSNHETYWVSLMAVQAARPHQQRCSRWTPEEILACLQSWAQHEGRVPLSSEFGPQWLLPSYSTIQLVCGSIQSAYTALGWPYTRYGGRRATGRSLSLGREGGDESDGSWMNGSPVREDGNALDWWEVI